MSLTIEYVREVLRYDPETGLFHWIAGQLKGYLAGTVHVANGREWVRIKVAGKCYYAHRLAWLLMTGEWPATSIDHADNDGQNNRWSNLRACSHAENMRNRKCRADNRLGLKGVSEQRSGRYLAKITVDGQTTYLGTFDTAEDAHAAYVAAAERLHGEFARAA